MIGCFRFCSKPNRSGLLEKSCHYESNVTKLRFQL